MIEIPESFLNLYDTEIFRPRQDGLTTGLITLAKHLNYAFVGSKFFQEQCRNAGVKFVRATDNFRGARGGYIWDHYEIYKACYQMKTTFDSLNEQFESSKRELFIVKAMYLSRNRKIAELEAEIALLKKRKRRRKRVRK